MNPVASIKELSVAEVAALIARLGSAARAAGFHVEPFGEVSGIPLLALTRQTHGLQPRVYVSAGIHGDEPAPPGALLQLVERGFFNENCAWFICPLLNPCGLIRGTRENHEARDLNRDYRSPQTDEVRAHVAWLRRQPPFDLTLSLHEDWESKGFYLYEFNPDQSPSLAKSIIEAVAMVCTINLSKTIDGHPASAGIVKPASDPAKRERWSESMYLRTHHSRLCYTLETPSTRLLRQRIASHMTAVTTAIGCFLHRSPPKFSRIVESGAGCAPWLRYEQKNRNSHE